MKLMEDQTDPSFFENMLVESGWPRKNWLVAHFHANANGSKCTFNSGLNGKNSL